MPRRREKLRAEVPRQPHHREPGPGRRRKGGHTSTTCPSCWGFWPQQEELKPLPEDAAFLGELSLTGRAAPGDAVCCPWRCAAARMGVRTLYVPAQNAAEATLADGLTVYGVSRASPSSSRHLQRRRAYDPRAAAGSRSRLSSRAAGLCRCHGAGECEAGAGDRRRRRPQHPAHRLLPARASPCWPSRLPSILPDMTRAGGPGDHGDLLRGGHDRSAAHPLVDVRPFRSPHHTAVRRGHGGRRRHAPARVKSPWPTTGSCFWTSCRSFDKDVAGGAAPAAWRTGWSPSPAPPGTLTLPSRFMLVCAMNPCQLRLVRPPLRPLPPARNSQVDQYVQPHLRSPAGPDRHPCRGALRGVRGHAPQGEAGVLRRHPVHGSTPPGRCSKQRFAGSGGILQRPDDAGHDRAVLRAGRCRREADAEPPLTVWASPPAAMTASCAWPAPLPIWRAPPASKHRTWPKPSNTAAIY